jgi:hypothetical protein
VDAPETVTEAVQQLVSLGYDADFLVDAEGVHCRRCGTTHVPEQLIVIDMARFEGATDPADEAVVFGVECTRCGARGILVSAYGPDADPDVFATLRRLGR